MFFGEKRIFITGTDTDVGKTYVCVKLIKMLEQQGVFPGYYKPLATGGIEKNGRLISEDVEIIKTQTSIRDDYNFINPILFKMPAAPLIAAESEKKIIDIEQIEKGYSEIKKRYDSFIVEGVGGVLVPITRRLLVIDLIKRWKLPVILVSKATIGNINQTLLSINILKNAGINILGIIISYVSKDDPGEPVKKSFEVIKHFCDVKILKEFPYKGDC